MAQTALQDQKQNEQAASGLEAALPVAIDTGTTIPPFYQQNHISAEMAKNPQITPPSEGEIHKQMWVSSMMMGLMASLATGNVAGGIVGGMWAAIGVHDYGNSLRQRSQYIDQLKGDGYSFPAILKWYEDGDSKELDKERTDMLQRDRMAQQDAQFNTRMNQQDKQFEARQALQESEFGQRMAMQGAQLAAAESRFERSQAGMDRRTTHAEQTQNLAQARQALRETQDTFKGAKAKQYYMQMSLRSTHNLEDAIKHGDKAAAAAAYNEARSSLARAYAGGNATLTGDQLNEFSGMPAWSDSKMNSLNLAVNGMPTQLAVDTLKSSAVQGMANEISTIKQQGGEAYNNFISQGYDPEQAATLTAHAVQGTGVGNVDWQNESKTATGQETPQQDKTPDNSTTPATVNWNDLK
jgi:hypothetical protein